MKFMDKHKIQELLLLKFQKIRLVVAMLVV